MPQNTGTNTGGPSEDRFSRRGLLKACSAMIAGTAGAGTAAALGPAGVPETKREPLRPLDLTPDDVDVVPSVPEAAEGVRPGSLVSSDVGGCTANFVWLGRRKNDDGTVEKNLYIGTAGHCLLDSAPASANATRDGETGEDLSDLTVVADVDGEFGRAASVVSEFVELGEVVYARQDAPPNASGDWDFGLIQLPPELELGEDVKPSLPTHGGPEGVSDDPLPVGETAYIYGAGIGYGEAYPTKGRSGAALGGADGGYQAALHTSNGDSGAPVVGGDAEGEQLQAAGVHNWSLKAGYGGGTTIGRCKEMVTDIGLEIEVVTVDG